MPDATADSMAPTSTPDSQDAAQAPGQDGPSPALTRRRQTRRPAIIDHIIVVDRLSAPVQAQPGRLIITPQDYIAGHLPYDDMAKRAIRVVNLCQDYSYLKTGYYVSLLADARGHRCVPAISDIAHANWKRIYMSALAELNTAIQRQKLTPQNVPVRTALVFFGRTDVEPLQRFARKVFDLFRLPALRMSFIEKNGALKLDEVEDLTLAEIKANAALFNESLNQFTGAFWSKGTRNEAHAKYWLAILHDPEEALPPSNANALKKMVRVGRKNGFFVELITRRDLDSLLEYDALFIRETTAVNNHTFRFAQKAESEGIPTIDDTLSILRCCNKVYLQELLRTKGIRVPGGYFLYRRQKSIPDPSPESLPLVLKVPDGSFSRGVFKVKTVEEFRSRLDELFKKSELVLVQEFLPSTYDWRIVVLGGKPLFACKYHMAPGHWQIYNHSAKNDDKYGLADCVPVDEVPQKVMKAALKAADLIGEGLYGVDLKESGGKVYVIEINDNPNIDAGVEDQILGDRHYAAIFDHFRQLIDA